MKLLILKLLVTACFMSTVYTLFPPGPFLLNDYKAQHPLIPLIKKQDTILLEQQVVAHPDDIFIPVIWQTRFPPPYEIYTHESTLILWALKKNYLPCIPLFLAYGASIDKESRENEAFIEICNGLFDKAISQDSILDVVKLLQQGAPRNKNALAFLASKKQELFKAIEQDRSEIVKKLLKRGMSIHIKDNLGNTLLHKALQAHSKETTKILLCYGAMQHIMKSNKRELTPLNYIANSPYSSMQLLAQLCV
ncbi:ankyrin repeat domain-containing protein [Candidatus Dependentiae bacterium]|nr:ankyrin repeat domain-containing protein [Candidatus Dependentiae bacterium]